MQVSFDTLSQRYGEPAAYALLLEMERQHNINSHILTHIEPEVRLQHVLAMNDNQPATVRLRYNA